MVAAQAFYELRFNTINKLRQTKKPNPYPHKFNVTQSIPKFIAEWGQEAKIEKGSSAANAKTVSLNTTSYKEAHYSPLGVTRGSSHVD